MAHYSIFIPGIKGATDAHLERVGLGDLCREGGPSWTELISGGPNRLPGMVATWTPHMKPELDPSPGYFPDRQTWLERDGWWFGFEPDRSVEPADLAYKANCIAGQRCLLADGQYWLIPHATRLPHRHALRNGKWTRVPAKRFESFYHRSLKVMELLFEALDLKDYMEGRVEFKDLPEEVKTYRFELEDGADFCCEALALNYRVTPEIVDCLGLLDDRSMIGMFWTILEMQDIIATKDQKKSTEFVDIPVTSNT